MGAAMAMGGVVGPVYHSLIITLGLILGDPVFQSNFVIFKSFLLGADQKLCAFQQKKSF